MFCLASCSISLRRYCPFHVLIESTTIVCRVTSWLNLAETIHTVSWPKRCCADWFIVIGLPAHVFCLLAIVWLIVEFTCLFRAASRSAFSPSQIDCLIHSGWRTRTFCCERSVLLIASSRRNFRAVDERRLRPFVLNSRWKYLTHFIIVFMERWVAFGINNLMKF